MRNPCTRRIAPSLASMLGLALLVLAGQASARSLAPLPCPPLATPIDAAVRGEDTRMQSIRENLDGGAILLGHRGERVPAPLALFTVSDPDPEPRFWPDAVDWSPYTLADGSETNTVFERASGGAICRILQSVSLRGKRIETGAYRLTYDAQGRVAGYVQYVAGQGGRLAVARQACVDRNEAGAIVALHEAGCVAPAGQGATEVTQSPTQTVHFVRDASSGRILRRIDLRAGVEGAEVRRYDADGSMVRLRAHPSADGVSAYAEPTASKERLWILPAGKVPPLNIEIGDEPWRVVRIPAEVLALPDEASWNPDTHTLLFEGKTNASGEVVLGAAQQAKLREALRQTPGQILLYINPMSRLQPVQALTPDTWRRCLDPAQARADACG